VWALADVMPELWTGTADLAGSNNITMKSVKSFRPPEQLVALGVSDAGTAATAIAIATAYAGVAGTAAGALNGLLVASTEERRSSAERSDRVLVRRFILNPETPMYVGAVVIHLCGWTLRAQPGNGPPGSVIGKLRFFPRIGWRYWRGGGRAAA
jgi:hypothetical protein